MRTRLVAALASAADHSRTQKAIAALALTAAQSARTAESLTRSVAAHQLAAAQAAEAAVVAMLAEQGIEDTAAGALETAAFVGIASDGTPLRSVLALAETATQLAMIVLTQVLDTGRSASGVSTAMRPAVTGYVRYLTPPSCARCAILAGRFYRWSDGFLRHPRCDCVMLPSTQAASEGLTSDPTQAFLDGQVRGLSQADERALADGADLARLVNTRSRRAGLATSGSSRRRRSQAKPTPEQIYAVAQTREEAVRLLTDFGYIRT